LIRKKLADKITSEKNQPARRRTFEKYRQSGISRHMTVRISRGLTEAIEEFLKTEQASKMGYHSKADVVTVAVRNLLTEYGVYEIPKKAPAKMIKEQ